MSKTYRIVSTLVIVGVVAFAVYYLYQQHRVRKAGVLTEKIVHQGDQWTADFTARVAAPEAQVFDTIKNFDKGHYDEIKNMQVISQSDNEKTIEMQIAAVPGQVTTTRVMFQYFPDQHRITYHSLDSGPFATSAEYDLTDEGANTLLRFRDTTTVAQQLPIPDMIVKRFIRGYFVSQLQGLQKTLNIADADSGDDSDQP
jgi:carbon monoxide dehydrogenase subunit G